MSHNRIIVWVCILYTIFMSFFILIKQEFDGLKFLSIYSLFISWFFTWWLIHVFKTTYNENEIKEIKKGQLYLIFFFIFIFPMAFGLNQKIAILFFDVDKYYDESKVEKAIMIGSNGGELNRFSGGALSTIMSSKNMNFPIACNLIIKEKCDYSKFYNQEFLIKYKDDLSYPFKNFSLIFEINGNGFYRGADYHIRLYKENKKYVYIYIVFILFFSVFVMLYVPRLFIINKLKGI